jgi:hypothetical protein
MNSIPLVSSAACIFLTVSPRPPNWPSADSNRAIVGSEMPECRARSDWDHPSNARAALICRIVVNLGFQIDRISIDKAPGPFNRNSIKPILPLRDLARRRKTRNGEVKWVQTSQNGI